MKTRLSYLTTSCASTTSRGASPAIMKDGRLILARGDGYADPEYSEEAVQPDSIFAIASLSKVIHATLSYEAWQARHFTPAELSQPEISGDEADLDGDGISNLIEYAHGSDPRAADQESWLKGHFVGDGNQLRLAVEYRRRPLGHAVTYEMEVSSGLKTWQPFDAAANEQLSLDGMLTVNIQDAATDANLGARFYRVNVRRAHSKT